MNKNLFIQLLERDVNREINSSILNYSDNDIRKLLKVDNQSDFSNILKVMCSPSFQSFDDEEKSEIIENLYFMQKTRKLEYVCKFLSTPVNLPSKEIIALCGIIERCGDIFTVEKIIEMATDDLFRKRKGLVVKCAEVLSQASNPRNTLATMGLLLSKSCSTEDIIKIGLLDLFSYDLLASLTLLGVDRQTNFDDLIETVLYYKYLLRDEHTLRSEDTRKLAVLASTPAFYKKNLNYKSSSILQDIIKLGSSQLNEYNIDLKFYSFQKFLNETDFADLQISNETIVDVGYAIMKARNPSDARVVRWTMQEPECLKNENIVQILNMISTATDFNKAIVINYLATFKGTLKSEISILEAAELVYNSKENSFEVLNKIVPEVEDNLWNNLDYSIPETIEALKNNDLIEEVNIDTIVSRTPTKRNRYFIAAIHEYQQSLKNQKTRQRSLNS